MANLYDDLHFTELKEKLSEIVNNIEEENNLEAKSDNEKNVITTYAGMVAVYLAEKCILHNYDAGKLGKFLNMEILEYKE